MKVKHCQWCDSSFETKISYQIYCSPNCRAEATREKVAERYAISKRGKASHKNRKCKSCGGALSVYNDESICQHCLIDPKEFKSVLRQIKGISNGKIKLDPEES